MSGSSAKSLPAAETASAFLRIRMKHLILYDLDGTLLDTREDIARSANFMLRQMERPELSPEEIARYVGRGLHHLIQNCLKTRERRVVEKGAAIYRDYYGKHMLDHSRLFPGALELLRHFQGRVQAVITNKPNPFSEDLLKALGVAAFFQEVIAGDSGFARKPDPEAILYLMKKNGVEPGDALFVGDSAVDVETARRAGIQAACILHGFGTENELQSARPDFLVTGFAELLQTARNLAW